MDANPYLQLTGEWKPKFLFVDSLSEKVSHTK